MKTRFQALRKRLFGAGREEALASFRALFERFRNLLDANNRVLGLIADMGDKLSGDYVFDTRYLEKTVEEIERLVQSIIDDLNVITGDRYPELREAFARIQKRVRAELELEPGGMDGPLVLPLEEADLDHLELVGGKMGTLGEIRTRLGLAVPPGFVVTTAAFRAFLSREPVASVLTQVQQRLTRGDDPGAVADEVRTAILAADLPGKLHGALRRAVSKLEADGHEFFAVRSSAVGEDGSVSFAGIHRSYLQVPSDQVADRYKEVVASLFSPEAVAYRAGHGMGLQDAAMAVGVLAMVDPVVSGVVYSRDPEDAEQPVILITAAWGLARTVVDGSSGADHYRVERYTSPPRVLEARIGNKLRQVRLDPQAGEREVDVGLEYQGCSSLSQDQIQELVEVSEQLETYFRCPQDIEWCFTNDHGPVILQSRPLRVRVARKLDLERVSQVTRTSRVLMEDVGLVACRGIGAGKVIQVLSDEDFDRFEKGAVLVARSSSPRLSRVIPLCAAIVTDIGTPTGHMATVAREYRVPTLVDTQDATQVLLEGMEVTVDAEEGVVYEGIIRELLHFQTLVEQPFADAREFRVLRRLVKTIAPLYLTDPQAKAFTAANCQTYHDVTRFCHEMVVQEFINLHLRGGRWRRIPTRRLDLPVPLGLVVIDIGGGVADTASHRVIRPDQVESRPLKALLEGLCAEGAWRTAPVDIDFRSFMTSFTRTSQLTAMDPGEAQNLAVVSRDYMNVNLRLGYHFNMVDALMSENRNDNYVYFRFMGGVTDLSRRSRRARFLAEVLGHFDYLVEIKGDLLVARVRKIGETMMHESLVMAGRLIGFARQLDVLMKSDDCVTRFVEEFLELETRSRAARAQGGSP